MAVFTSAELDTQIAAYKAGLLALATAQEVTIDTGISRTQFTRADISKIKDILLWLQSEKDQLAGNSAGRTFAKQGGTGRW